MNQLITFFKTFSRSVKLFINNDVLRMSAALSFYTFFALAPVMLIIIFSTNWLISGGKIEAGIYNEMATFLGTDAAAQLQGIIVNSGKFDWGNPTSTISVLALFFSATGVFTEIQSSVNIIWSLKAKPKKGWLKYLMNRMISLSVILGLGFILLVSLVLSAGIDILLAHVSRSFSDASLLLSVVVNFILTLTIISTVFAIIFKFLPDARVEWKHILLPSIITGILFMGGKFLISYYIGKTNPTKAYGAAGSIVIVLLWVYYSSMILYFGACYAKALAQVKGSNIYPNDYAVFVEQVEVLNEQSLQNQEDNIEVKKKDVELTIKPQAAIPTKTT